MIEVYKTNIIQKDEAEHIKGLILQYHPRCKINMDLDDCDRILRVEGDFDSEHIIHILSMRNLICEPLR